MIGLFFGDTDFPKIILNKIKKIVNQICKIKGKGKPQFGKISYRQGENMKLYPNINKARIKLKWKPKMNFNRGIKIVVNSFK